MWDAEMLLFFDMLHHLLLKGNSGIFKPLNLISGMKYVYLLTEKQFGESLRPSEDIYTEQKYKRNIFVFAPIFHELNSKI